MFLVYSVSLAFFWHRQLWNIAHCPLILWYLCNRVVSTVNA